MLYQIERYGWWAPAGASIVIRHLSGRDLQRALAVCTNKALEVADKLDHWFIRERVFTLQYLGHSRLSEASGVEIDYVVDDEDRARIVSLMGRFPNFRQLGWRILDSTSMEKARLGIVPPTPNSCLPRRPCTIGAQKRFTC